LKPKFYHVFTLRARLMKPRSQAIFGFVIWCNLLSVFVYDNPSIWWLTVNA